MSHEQPSSNELAAESILVRLFRCMDIAAQEQLIFSAFGLLLNATPTSTENATDNETANLADSDGLSWWLMSLWPGDWPGRELIELDNLGDAGAWLKDEVAPILEEALFGLPFDRQVDTTDLARRYLACIREASYPLPSDFSDSPVFDGWTDEEEQAVSLEFQALFRHWRELVLQNIEQRRSSMS